MKWIYLVGLALSSICFCVAVYHDDVQHMVMWGVIELTQLICLKAEELKEEL